MGDGSGGGAGSADSYIGSLISLTSKSEIRYEGILYTVDTENSNIALQDVRSFGTEGRKKDGPQIPPSDKIFDYIIFRGSDIKDLQVKSSPPIQPAQAHPHRDPAIISLQPQLSQPAAPIPSSFMPSAAGTLADGGNPTQYTNIPTSAYRNSLPSLYQPGAGLGSWVLPPAPPGANGSLAMPMYWQGYYRPPSGISHLQQQPPIPFQPPPTLPPSYLPQAQSLPQLLSAPTTLPAAISTPLVTQVAPLQQPNLPLISSKDSLVTAAIPSDILTSSTALPVLIPAMASSIPAVLSVAPLTDTTLMSTSEEKTAVKPTTMKLPQKISGPAVSNSQSVGSFLGQNAVNLSSSTVPPTLLAPGQLLQPVGLSAPVKSFVATTQSSISEQKLTEPSTTAAPLIPTPPLPQPQQASNQPLLQLPLLPVNPSHHKQINQANGSLGNINYMRRGRGRDRGSGVSQPQKQFTEDFDFTAMNEKFNKDEVWGELGKGDARDKDDGEEDTTEDGHGEEESHHGQANKSVMDLPRTPVYVKDNFFDTLSCDALGGGGQTERTKFSEQRKIDTETFGSFPVRSRSGRGGRSGGYRGFRASYYGGQGMGGGRGNGNGGRGRNFSRASAAI